MTRTALVLLIGLGLVATAAAQSSAKKVEASEVELTFANGSVVRMTLLPDDLDIETQFGKLRVPVREIRRIDFGLHLPDGADMKIATAIKKLSSAEFKERDAAVRELVSFGAYAYPALLQAVRSDDLETSKRAQDAIAQVKARVPAADLRLSDEDKIVTPRFTIVGRILSPTIKAKSEYFGDVEHSLAKLRQLRMLSEARESVVVVIDAAKYATGGQWLDTGMTLNASATLSVMASGEVELRPSLPGTYVCGPRGYTRVVAGFGKAKKADGPGRVYPGTLMGRIGDKSEGFVLADRFEGVPDQAGKLYLQIVSSPYDTMVTGTYQVKISVRD